MPTNANKRPKITWGASYANTLVFLWSLDDWRAYAEPRAGSQVIQVESGEEDSFILGWDFYLEGTVNWINGTDIVSPAQTGWDGSTGWDAFLQAATARAPFRWYPDKDAGTYYNCTLCEPFGSAHELNRDGTRSIRIKLRNISGSFLGY